MAGDGAVVKGRAYGVRSIRVDGNDALAIYSAVHAAREMAIGEGRPMLIEVKCLSFSIFLSVMWGMSDWCFDVFFNLSHARLLHIE